jgi:hypothetical protein
MNKIKKLLALVLVLTLVFAFTGCTTGTAAAATELTVSEEEKNPDMAEYSNDYDGLVQYMKDCELIAGEGTDMSADFIGADKGQKFTYKYSETTITCELYEFNTDNISEKAQETIGSVKENGTFTALDKDVDAVLSDSGKFLMIYVNKSGDDVQKAFTERTNEKFKTFVGK